MQNFPFQNKQSEEFEYLTCKPVLLQELIRQKRILVCDEGAWVQLSSRDRYPKGSSTVKKTALEEFHLSMLLQDGNVSNVWAHTHVWQKKVRECIMEGEKQHIESA
jgi:hypothetical protein